MTTRTRSIKRMVIAALAVAVFMLTPVQAQTPASKLTDNHFRNPSEFRFDLFRFSARRQSLSSRPAGFSLMPAPSASINAGAVTPLAAGPNLQVLGSGTIGRLAKWTGLTSGNSIIGDTTIFESKTGLVGIGTDTPTSKLTVAGMIEITLGGLKFPDGTIQTTSAAGALFLVAHDATLQGNGTSGSPLGVAIPLNLTGSKPDSSLVSVQNNSVGGVGVSAIGGEGGDAVLASGGGSSSDRGGIGVRAQGGNSSRDGGFGIVTFGGDGSPGGGNGMFAQGGNGSNFGGAGVTAQGGNGSLLSGAGVIALAGSGAIGVDAKGGQSSSGDGGDGVRAEGGRSITGLPGDGIEATGGISIDGGLGGPGVRATGGLSNGQGGVGVFGLGGTGSGAGGVGGTGILARGGSGTNGASDGIAGGFEGDVVILGDLNVSGTKNFKIDHPLDPENKYLYHAAIESAEALNVYSGNVKLDASGEATVKLPDWFEALNKDFRYSLTSIGVPSQGLYIAEEVSNNQFKVAGGRPGAKVSWQVTGIRSDAAMRSHPFKVEEEKPERERGFYLHPEASTSPKSAASCGRATQK